jgi:hypothetical protein
VLELTRQWINIDEGRRGDGSKALRRSLPINGDVCWSSESSAFLYSTCRAEAGEPLKLAGELWKPTGGLWKLADGLWKPTDGLWKPADGLWKPRDGLWKASRTFSLSFPKLAKALLERTSLH